MTTFTYGAVPLSADGLHAACDKLGVKAAEIWTVIFTETDPPYGGFWPDASPQILYEQHIFSRITKNKFDASNPDISNPKSGNYGATGQHQYDRLAEAIALDESGALQSASWGMGQTLGMNFKEAGFATVQALVAAMFASEDQQIIGTANEMISTECAKALELHDWKTFAKIYNGGGYAKNHYDTKLASWYAKMNAGGLPDLDVRAAQFYLTYVGLHPGPMDGLWGKTVRGAWNEYQTKAHLPLTDHFESATFARLKADAEAIVDAKNDFGS